MASRNVVVAATAGLLLLLGAVAVRLAAPRGAEAVVRVAGSSTVFPILEAATTAYRRENPRARVEIEVLGTTGGLRQFCRDEVPIANASRPISSEELKACEAAGVRFIELPIAFDALTVVVNPGNSWVQRITPAQLSRIWSRSAQNTIITWRQVEADWPDRPLTLCGPGEDSGTFDYFNEAINGSAGNSRSDYTASEDDEVLVNCVARQPDAMAYFGFSYYNDNRERLQALAIVGPKGAVEPSIDAVQQGRYLPLSRPLFLYVNDTALRQRPEVRRFITSVVRDGQTHAAEAGVIPLPTSTYMLAESKLYRHVLGTSFGGDLPVGLTIGQALSRSFDAIRREGYR